MLKKILMIARRGRPMSVDALSDELGVDTGMVDQMICDLCRRGYLREYPLSSACSGGCGGCSRKKVCGNVSGGIVAWSLTEKGKRAGTEMQYA